MSVGARRKRLLRIEVIQKHSVDEIGIANNDVDTLSSIDTGYLSLTSGRARRVRTLTQVGGEIVCPVVSEEEQAKTSSLERQAASTSTSFA